MSIEENYQVPILLFQGMGGCANFVAIVLRRSKRLELFFFIYQAIRVTKLTGDN